MVPGPGTPLTISVCASPDHPCVWVGLVGDVDLTAEPFLAEAAGRLGGLTVHLTVVDVAAVTFAGSTLSHFLDTLHDAHPDATLVLRHPSPLIRLVLAITGQDRFVVMNSDSRSGLDRPPGIGDDRSAVHS